MQAPSNNYVPCSFTSYSPPPAVAKSEPSRKEKRKAAEVEEQFCTNVQDGAPRSQSFERHARQNVGLQPTMEGFMRAFTSCCSLRKEFFNPEKLQKFLVSWEKQLHDIENSAHRLWSNYSTIDKDFRDRMEAKFEEKMPTLSAEEKTLFSFHETIFAVQEKDATMQLAYRSVLFSYFTLLHLLFDDLMPNYVQEIQEQQVLVPIFALFPKLVAESKSSVPELLACLQSADPAQIEAFKQKCLEAGLVSFEKVIKQFVELNDERKSGCLQMLIAFLDVKGV